MMALIAQIIEGICHWCWGMPACLGGRSVAEVNGAHRNGISVSISAGYATLLASGLTYLLLAKLLSGDQENLWLAAPLTAMLWWVDRQFLRATEVCFGPMRAMAWCCRLIPVAVAVWATAAALPAWLSPAIETYQGFLVAQQRATAKARDSLERAVPSLEQALERAERGLERKIKARRSARSVNPDWVAAIDCEKRARWLKSAIPGNPSNFLYAQRIAESEALDATCSSLRSVAMESLSTDTTEPIHDEVATRQRDEARAEWRDAVEKRDQARRDARSAEARVLACTNAPPTCRLDQAIAGGFIGPWIPFAILLASGFCAGLPLLLRAVMPLEGVAEERRRAAGERVMLAAAEGRLRAAMHK